MFNFCIIFIFNFFLLVQNANAQVDTTRLRPSYKETYSKCISNQNEFKENLIIEVYQTAIYSSASSLLGNISEINSLASTRGLTPKMYTILNSETFSVAINDCFGSTAIANNLIAKLLFIEGTGKFVGISAGTVAIYGLGKTLKIVSSSLKAFIPAAIYKKIVVATVIFGSVVSLRMLKKQFNEEDLADFSENSNSELNSWKNNLISKGTAQLELLDEQLKDPELSDSNRQQLLKLKFEWTTTLAKIK